MTVDIIPEAAGPVRPVTRANLNRMAAAHIRHAIFSGRLRPRQKIDQESVADALGISKLPVREALISLEDEGIVENIPRRGAFVAGLSPDDILDHYILIGLTSGLAARRAATALGGNDIEYLKSVLDDLDNEPDVRRQEELNGTFHRTINLAGGSLRLRSALRLLTQTMPEHFFEFAVGWRDQANKEHRRILRALRSRDGEAANHAMVEHISSGGQFALKRLEEAGFWD